MSGAPKVSALASKAQLLALSTPKFRKAVEDAKLVNGEQSIMVARAWGELGEHCLSIYSVEDLLEAKSAFEASMKIQVGLAGGKFSKGVYVWPEGYPPEEFLDTHYKLGQVLAAQANVSGESEVSRSHLQKTLGMREAYDKHTQEKIATAKAESAKRSIKGANVAVEETKKAEHKIGNVSSGFDSTLIYSDSAEVARIEGNFQEAEFLYLKSINLRRAKFGKDNPAIAPGLVKYAEALRMQFKYKEAKKALDEALAINMAAYGGENQATTETLNNLGQINRLLGNHDEAEALLLEALQLRRKLFGDFHVLTASTLNNLAELFRERGDYFQAISYHNAAVEAFTEAEGPDHPGTINARGNLGVTLRRQAKSSLQQGESLVKEALYALQQKQYDEQHPWLVKFGMENMLAQASKLNDQGKFDESIDLYDSLISKKHVMAQLKALGGNAKHMSSAPNDDASVGSVGSKAQQTSKYSTKEKGGGADDDASVGSGGNASLGSGLSSTRQKFHRPVSQDLVVLTEGRVEGMLNKAKKLLFKGLYGEADSVLNSCLVPAWSVLGEESYLLYRGTLLHAEVKIMLAQYELSNALLVDMLQRWTDLKGPEHVEVAYAAALLAYLYYIQGMYDASHTLYAQVAEVVGMKLTLDPLATKRTGSEHNILYCNVLLGLAKVNIKLAKFADVLAALEQARQLLHASVTLESPLHLELHICYAHVRFFAGDLKGARQLYQQCLAKAVDLFDSKTHATCAYLAHKLARVEFLLGNLPRASAFLEESLYMRLKIFKDDHPDVAASEVVKGQMITSLGRYDEAIVCVERALVNQRISLGPRHPAVARSLLTMASVFDRKGLPREAADLIKQAMDINREVFGRLDARVGHDTVAEGENAVAPHPVVVDNLLAQGVNEALSGRVMMAQILLERVLSEREMIYAALREVSASGPDGQAEQYAIDNHLSLAEVHYELGRVYVLQGVPHLAVEHLTQAGMAISQVCGDSSMRTADVLVSLGDASHVAGCYRDAQLQYSRAAVIYTTEQGAIHPVVSLDIAMRAASNIAHVGYLASAERMADYLLGLYQNTSQLPSDGVILADLLSLKARILVDRGWVKEDMAPVNEAVSLLKHAQSIALEHVGEDSLLNVRLTLQLCNCQIRLNEAEQTDGLLKKCIANARKALEHPDNNNVGPTLNYKDKHPILGDIACARAWLANPLQKAGKHNAESLRIMEKEAVPLFRSIYGEDHIKYSFVAGRMAVFRNLDQKGSGTDILRLALKALEEAPVTKGQLFFTNDSTWVAALGSYESARLKSLGAFSDKFTEVFPFCPWAIVNPQKNDDNASVGSAGSAPSKAGVVIAGVGQAPDYPECPPADALLLSDSPQTNLWGSRLNDGQGTRRDKKRVAPAPPAGGGILALAIFNGEAPVSMAVADIFGTGGNSDQRIALQKAAEAKTKEAYVADLEPEPADDNFSLASNSIAGDGPAGEEEKAALEQLRTEHKLELENIEAIRGQRREEEDAMLAVKAQREAEEDLVAKAKEELMRFQLEMEEFKKKHQEELEKVKAEMLAAQKVAEAVKAVVVPDTTAVDVAAEESDALSMSEIPHANSEIPAESEIMNGADAISLTVSDVSVGANNFEGLAQSVSHEKGVGSTTASVVVAVAENEALDGKEKSESAESNVTASVEAIPRPIVVQAAGNKARMALDAASFLFDRAVDFRAKGWYSKSNPILAECLSIRETYATECAQMGMNSVSLCAQTKLELSCNLTDMCLWNDAIKPLDEVFKVRNEQSNAKGGGSNGLGNGKSRELADVLEAQARNYYFMSMHTEAQQKFLDAVKMRTDVSNAGDPQIGRCICAQSLNMCAQGKFLEAKATAEKGHAILTKAYGAKNVHAAEGFMARIIILAAMGKHKDANPLMQQCMSMRRRLLDNSHPLIADACLLTASTLIEQDRFVEAEKWVKDATDMYLVYFDEQDVRVSAARQQQARLLRIYGKYQDAIRLQTDIYRWRKDFIVVPAKPEKPTPPTADDIKRMEAKKKIEADWDEEIDGPRPVPVVAAPVVVALVNSGEHHLISESLIELAQCHLLLGEFTKGVAYAKAALKMRKSVYADCLVNPAMADALFWRAEGYRLIGDMERARQNHDDALDLRRRSLGKEHSVYALSQYALANILRNRGIYEESEGMYRKALKLQQATCSDDSVDIAGTLNAYGECLRLRGNYKLALENNGEAMNILKMHFSVVNPNHSSILECAVNRGLIELDMLIPPPIVPEAVPLAENEDADEDDDVNLPNESVNGDMESAALSKAPSLVSRKDQPGFVLGDGIAIPRDANGVAIFQNSEYIRIRGIMQTAKATLINIFEASELVNGPPDSNSKKGSLPDDGAQVRALTYAETHPLCINLLGNVAIVDKLEAEAKMRFLFSLGKDDKKLFEAAEKRALLEGPSDIENRVLAESEEGNAADDKSVQSAGSASVMSKSRNAQSAVPDDEKLPQYMLDLDDALAGLLHIGLLESHPWMRKFRAYRLIAAKPPDEMAVAVLAFKEAEKMKRKGLYVQADQKYDEAISLQIEHLGHTAASTNAAVATSVYAKAHIARIQCKFTVARQLFMQSFSVCLKIDGFAEVPIEEETAHSRAGSPTPGRHPNEDAHVTAATPLSEGCARAYFGLAEIYRAQGQPDIAQILHEKVFAMRVHLHIIKGKFIAKGKPAYRNHPSIMQSLAALSELALSQGDLVLAREHAEAAMTVCENLGRNDPACYFVDDYGNVCDLKRLIGRIFLAEGKFLLAEEHFLAAQALRLEAIAPLFGPHAADSPQQPPVSSDSVASSTKPAKSDDHPDCSHDYYDLSLCYLAMQRLPEAKKLVAKCMKLRLKFFGRLKYNAAKLTISSKQFLENLLEGDTYPEIDLIEKRLITQVGNTTGGVGDKVNEAFARDPAASNDYDLTSVLDDGSLAEGSIDQASAQYVASHAVVVKALEIPTGLDGERLPAFVYRNVPVSNHYYVADVLALRADIALEIGELEEARLMCGSALNIRKDLMGRKSLASGMSLFQLARITQLCGVLSESMSLHVMAADIKTQFLPNVENHPDLVDSLLHIGSLKILLSNFDEGHFKLQSATDKTIHVYGRDHLRCADAWLAHSEYFRLVADYSKASSLVQRALKIYKAVLPEYHGKIGIALCQEARIQICLGMLDVAYTLTEQGSSHFAMVFSDAHYHTITSQQIRAEILTRRGKVLEAKSVIEMCLTSRRDMFGKQNWQTAYSLYSLAGNLCGLGRYITAQPIYERAVQLLRRALGLENLLVATAMVALGDCYVQNAEYDKAKSLYDAAHHIRIRLTSYRKSANGNKDEGQNATNMHPDVADSLSSISELHLLHGNYSLAVQGFDDALAMRRATLGHMHSAVAESMHSLGCCYFMQGLYSEAKQIFERALKMRKTVLPADHYQIQETQLYIARVNQSHGKLEQSAAMYERCLINLRIARGSRHPSIGRVLYCLGDVSNELGNYDLALSYFLDSLVIRKASFGIAIQVQPEKERPVPGAVVSRKKISEKVDDLPAPKKDKFHPEIAETLFGMAESYRLKGLYAEPETNLLSTKGEELIKNDSGLVTAADLVAIAARNKAIENGGSIASKHSRGLDEASVDISLSTPGRREQEAYDDKSVMSVGLASIEAKLEALGADVAGDFDDASSLGDASHMGLHDYAGAHDSPIKNSPIKAETRPRFETEAAEKMEEEEEHKFAMPLYEKCLDMILTIFGNEHPAVFGVQQAIASTLQALGNFMLSHDLFQHVLSHRRRLLGDNHLHTCESMQGVADILRAMSHVWPTNNAAAAEKRIKKVKVNKGIGPSLTEYLSSILGADERLKNQWPPEVTHDLTLIAAGRGKVVMHPLLQRKAAKAGSKYLGGYMGYQYSAPKKLQRDRRFIEANVTRPTISFLTDAKWLYDTGLAGCKASLGEHAEHPVVASLLYGKAELMRARKENDDAMALYEQSLHMRRHILKGTHPAIADVLVGMAETLRYENKFTKAEPLLIKAIQIRQNAYASGDSHPSIPDGQCSLGMLYFSMGRYLEAQPLFSESLRTRERILGKSHIATSQSLNNYAGLLHTTGKFDRALPFYRRALEIKTEALGEDHPDVASAKNNIGLLLKAMGKYDEAKQMYDEALASLRNVFGELHADVASTLNNMAALYVAMGDVQKGKDFYRESLHIKKKVLGIDHVAVAATLNNLAGLCFSCNDMDDAKDYYEESLRIRRKVYGDDHVTVAESLNNIGLLLFSQGDFTSSQPLFERAIEIKAASFGSDHVSTASSQHNLAILFHKLKRFAEAEELYEKALSVRTEVLGMEHPDTINTVENMNSLLTDRDPSKPTTPSSKRPGSTGLALSGSLLQNGMAADSRYLVGNNIPRAQTPKRADDSVQSVLSRQDEEDSYASGA